MWRGVWRNASAALRERRRRFIGVRIVRGDCSDEKRYRSEMASIRARLPAPGNLVGGWRVRLNSPQLCRAVVGNGRTGRPVPPVIRYPREPSITRESKSMRLTLAAFVALALSSEALAEAVELRQVIS